MAIRAAEISDIIRQQLKDYTKSLEVRETGTVLSTGDGIARIHGLDQAAAGELLEFPNNIFGMVLNLEEDNVGAALFGEAHEIGEGDEVRRTGRIATTGSSSGSCSSFAGSAIDSETSGTSEAGHSAQVWPANDSTYTFRSKAASASAATGSAKTLRPTAASGSLPCSHSPG